MCYVTSSSLTSRAIPTKNKIYLISSLYTYLPYVEIHFHQPFDRRQSTAFRRCHILKLYLIGVLVMRIKQDCPHLHRRIVSTLDILWRFYWFLKVFAIFYGIMQCFISFFFVVRRLWDTFFQKCKALWFKLSILQPLFLTSRTWSWHIPYFYHPMKTLCLSSFYYKVETFDAKNSLVPFTNIFNKKMSKQFQFLFRRVKMLPYWTNCTKL